MNFTKFFVILFWRFIFEQLILFLSYQWLSLDALNKKKSFSFRISSVHVTKSGSEITLISIVRSSHQRCSMKKGVLGNFIKISGKHLCQSLFFNKRLWHRCFPVNSVKFLRPATLLKKRLWRRCFSSMQYRVWVFILKVTYTI